MEHWILPQAKEDINLLNDEEQQVEALKISAHDFNYVILDAAVWGFHMEDIFLKHKTRYCSLFATRGADRQLDSVAPYLLEYNQELKQWIDQRGRRDLRRLYIKSDCSLEKLRKHLRRFQRVKTAGGKWLFFRFYDPNVVNVVFPHLTQQQLEEFFRVIDYVVAIDTVIHERRIYQLSKRNVLMIKTDALNDVDHNK